MKLPEYVKTVIEMLKENGYEAFAVGGCVRDFLMGQTPKDYDVTTSANPLQIKAVFSSFKTVDTGLKHGTVTVLSNGEPIEVTTYRIDGDYSDNRHPDRVCFTEKLENDLSRRDFTMNAIAFNETAGFVDVFGGMEDIKNKTIRCVGDAEKRFTEDALRILRALRFASVLDFEIEENTEKAAFLKKDLLLNVSAERVSVELLKLLCGKGARRVILRYADILSVIIPEVSSCKGFLQNNPYHIYDVLEHTASVVENIPSEKHLRLAALLHDIGKPFCYSEDENGIGHFYGHSQKSYEIAQKTLSNLKLDNETKNRVLTLVKFHDLQIENTDKSVRRALNKFTPDMFFDLLKLFRADALAQSKECLHRLQKYEELQKTALEIIAQNQCFSLKDLKINGNDIKNLGVKQGEVIGKVLNATLEAVIDGKIKNESKELMNFAKTVLQNL